MGGGGYSNAEGRERERELCCTVVPLFRGGSRLSRSADWRNDRKGLIA